MGFLDLVEQHDGVGMTAHALSQLSALLIAYVSWRRTNQSRGVETLRIFTHVDTDERIGTAKHKLCQFLGQIGLAHTRRAEEHERADGVVGLLQSDAVALDGLHHLVDGLVLCDDGILQLLRHALQTDTLLFGHTLGRHTRHHRYHLGHLVSVDHLPLLVNARAPALVHLLQFCLEHRLTVAIAGSQFEVLILHGPLFLFLHLGNLFLLFHNLLRNLGITKMYARACLVEGVDGLIGHKAVCHVAVCQFDTCHEGIIRIGHMVMVLIAVLDVTQYL